MKVLIEFLRLKVIEVSIFFLGLLMVIVVVVGGIGIICFVLGCVVYGLFGSNALEFCNITGNRLFYELKLGGTTLYVLFVAGVLFFFVGVGIKKGIEWIKDNWRDAEYNVRNRKGKG